jgi:hypothetical protein
LYEVEQTSLDRRDNSTIELFYLAEEQHCASPFLYYPAASEAPRRTTAGIGMTAAASWVAPVRVVFGGIMAWGGVMHFTVDQARFPLFAMQVIDRCASGHHPSLSVVVTMRYLFSRDFAIR